MVHWSSLQLPCSRLPDRVHLVYFTPGVCACSKTSRRILDPSSVFRHSLLEEGRVRIQCVIFSVSLWLLVKGTSLSVTGKKESFNCPFLGIHLAVYLSLKWKDWREFKRRKKYGSQWNLHMPCLNNSRKPCVVQLGWGIVSIEGTLLLL